MAEGDVYDPERFVRARSMPEAAETAALLPRLNDPYKAAGFVDGEVPMLVLVMGKDGFRIGGSAYVALQYVHLGLGEFGHTADGHAFRYVFADIQPKLVTVEGRNLSRIFHRIGLRKTPWIRQVDRDLRGGDGLDNEPVITRIDVRDWTPPEERAKAPPREAAATPA